MAKKDIIAELSKADDDAKLNEEALKASKKLVTGERKDYIPSRVYELIFPNGIQLYYNRIVINFIEKRLEELAAKEAQKKKQFQNPIFGKIEG